MPDDLASIEKIMDGWKCVKSGWKGFKSGGKGVQWRYIPSIPMFFRAALDVGNFKGKLCPISVFQLICLLQLLQSRHTTLSSGALSCCSALLAQYFTPHGNIDSHIYLREEKYISAVSWGRRRWYDSNFQSSFILFNHTVHTHTQLYVCKYNGIKSEALLKPGFFCWLTQGQGEKSIADKP